MTTNPRRLLLVAGWPTDLSSAVAVTVYEPTESEIAERLSGKAVEDAFTADHFCDRATFASVAHSQADRCLECAGSLDPEAQYLSMDAGEGLYCSNCSPLRVFARSTQAALAGQGVHRAE